MLKTNLTLFFRNGGQELSISGEGDKVEQESYNNSNSVLGVIILLSLPI